MRERRAVGGLVAAALIVALAGYLRLTGHPVAETTWPAANGASASAVTRPGTTATYHVPAAGEHWQAGDTLAQPCPVATDGVSRKSLLRAGPVPVPVEGFSRPELQLLDGGVLDLSDGVLGVAGGEYLDSSQDVELTPVPAGRHPVTIAEVVDADDPTSAWLAAAEVRLSSATPVRWELHGGPTTDGSQAAWFGEAARLRFLGTGYDELGQRDAQGRNVIDVASYWQVPCYFLDVAPREPGQAHDVVMLALDGDGAYLQFIGYDADGRPAAAILQLGVPWSALALPGARPSGLAEDEESPAPGTDPSSPRR